MNYLCIDVGGSSLKHGLFNSENEILDKGTVSLKEVSSVSGMIEVIKNLYDVCERPEGGIAISYCGELDAETGHLLNGGSYPFMAGCNLKEELEMACNTSVSVENDGNCAGIAELTCGSLKGCNNAFALIVGTGLAGALIIDGHIYHGSHNYAGFLSLCVSDLSKPFALNNIGARLTSANYLGETYAAEQGSAEKIDGHQFFELIARDDVKAREILEIYAGNLANVVYNVQLVLDVEKITIGGGISVQPAFQEELKKAYDRIYKTTPLQYINPPKAELVFCTYNNDANMIGALMHHKEKAGK